MKPATFVAIAAIGMVLVSGCKSDRSIQGRWESVGGSYPGVSKLIVDFQANGFVEAVATLGEESSDTRATATGTWSQGGGKVTIQVNDIAFSGESSGFETMIEEQLKSQANRLSGEVKWNENGTVEIGQEGYRVVFRQAP